MAFLREQTKKIIDTVWNTKDKAGIFRRRLDGEHAFDRKRILHQILGYWQ